jgi:AraC-like DNA-binding protein
MIHDMRDEQIKLLWTARINYDQNSGVSTHQHQNFEQLLIVLEGDGFVHIHNNRYEVKSSRYYFFGQSQPHSFSFSKKTVTIDFKFLSLCAEIDKIIKHVPNTGACPIKEMDEFKKWFKLSLKNHQNPKPLAAFQIDAGFKGTLLALANDDSNSKQGAAQSKLDTNFPMALYLVEHLHEPVSLETLAEEFKFNSGYIINLFREHVGLTPIQYLQHVRLEKAKELLELTTLSLTAIAERVGWTLRYFSRIFLDREGVTPAAYRNKTITAIGKDIILDNDFSNIWRVHFPDAD